MGQKVHAIGFRVGIYRDWSSRWFAKGNTYGKLFLEDLAIRAFINATLDSAEISKIEIEKAGEDIRVIIYAARPGLIIGRRGQGIDELKAKIAAKFKKTNVEISVQEVANFEADAVLIAKSIVAQLLRRSSYKRAMKRASALAMRAGAKGIKICCSGRLQGAEIARSEWSRLGSIPLHTLRSDVDYGFAEAKTTYGLIGVKVWIYKGEFESI